VHVAHHLTVIGVLHVVRAKVPVRALVCTPRVALRSTLLLTTGRTCLGGGPHTLWTVQR
jgi:hypothetical protein